jgi:hypothetical protein
MSANAQHAVSHRYIQRCATFSVPPSRAVVGARASCSYLPDSHVRRISNGSGIALPKEFVLLRLLLFLAEIIAKHACIAARARADFVTDFLRASISFASCGLHGAFVA